MLRYIKINQRLAFSVAVALPTFAALGVYVYLFLSAFLRDPTQKHLVILLYGWQTQVTGAFAVAAALLGATVVLHQTSETRRVDEERRARRALASRAGLPMILNGVADYVSRGAGIYDEVWQAASGHLVRHPQIEVPELSNLLVEGLAEYIECNGNEDGGSELVTILRHLQIYRAQFQDAYRRARARNGSILVRHNLISRIISSAELYARCEKLFEYARFDTIEPVKEVSANDVKTALNLLPVQRVSAIDLEEEIDRRLNYAIKNGSKWPEA